MNIDMHHVKDAKVYACIRRKEDDSMWYSSINITVKDETVSLFFDTPEQVKEFIGKISQGLSVAVAEDEQRAKKEV